jgi:cytoskeleton protein RodZ
MTRHKEEIGQTLRDARQAAGLTLKDIADKIRVRPIYLQAIETGQFELLPALPQTVGFTRAYAKYLDVDVDQPLSRLGKEVHETIERADYSEPEIPWTMVPGKRIAWVGGGIVLGLLFAVSLVIDVDTATGEVSVASMDARLTAQTVPVRGNEILPTTDMRSAEPQLADMTSRAGGDIASRSPADETATIQQAAFVPAAGVTGGGAPREGGAPEIPGRSSVSGVSAMTVPVETVSVSAPANAVSEAEENGDKIFPFADPHFATSSVYIRAKPDNGGQAVGVLNSCERVALLGHDRTDYWREVKREDGTVGWVFRDYVSGEQPANCS